MPFPSFNSLRTFESAARLLSFNRAAEELCVSPSAVSHQIRQLESILGIKLFIRMDRRVILSPKGKLYYQKISRSISVLYEATSDLMDIEKRQIITISAVPFFATRWLMLHLERFRLAHPDWELSLNTSTEKSDFKSENLDIAIRRGEGHWPELTSVLLKHEYLTPVCSPVLAKRVLDMENLKKAPLLHNSQVLAEWHDWFSSINEPFELNTVLMEFQNTSQIMDACIAGAGIALIDPSLISEELDSGRLVMPLDKIVKSIRSYYLVYPSDQSDRETVKIFSGWISKEILNEPPRDTLIMSDFVQK